MRVHVIVEVGDTAKRVEVEAADGQDPLRNFEDAQDEMKGLVRIGRAVFRVSNVAGVITYQDDENTASAHETE